MDINENEEDEETNIDFSKIKNFFKLWTSKKSKGLENSENFQKRKKKVSGETKKEETTQQEKKR